MIFQLDLIRHNLSYRRPTDRTTGGVVNNASYIAQISPGSLMSIFGNYMAGSSSSGFALPLPTSYNGTSVLINGIAAPLLYVSPTLINAQVPVETAAGSVTVVVSYGGTSAATRVQVAAASPGLYYFASGGANLALAQHVDGSLVTASSPAHAGEILILYGTGIGPINPPLASGSPAGGYPQLSTATSSYSAMIGGADAPIDFLGLTPGLLGVMQINIHVPPTATPGNLPVALTINGVQSQPGLIVPVK